MKKGFQFLMTIPTSGARLGTRFGAACSRVNMS